MRPSSSEEDMQQEWLEIQAAQKDRAQFRPLYQRYYEPVFRFIYKRTADQSLSADICSVVFLKAMERLDRYTFQGVPFSAWLFRIASNEVAQHFRKNQRNRVVSAEEYHFKDLVEEMDEDWAQDLLPNLISHLDQLKEKDLVLIEMRFFEKRPFKEIAEILEITESNAKVRTYRILDRLKKKILENS
ncbi:MAG: sigma-70 family RNA polymerase sigma factor [Bacteroidota bacterium]